jgi:NAD(P)-dependent dehydrogenase (short-subunit alcohol dehydrogenase family)
VPRRISLEGRVVIVTGGGRGIGRGLCLELAGRGAAVVVDDRIAENADEVARLIVAGGGRAVACHESVSTPEGARAIVGTALEHFGTVDAVVNNAGYMSNAYLEQMTAEQLDEMLDVHVRGSFLVTQAAWPVMREKGYGRVVMTSSAGGLFAMQAESNYAAAKAGVYGLGKALAFEGARHGILVNTILPMAAAATEGGNVPDYDEHYPAGLRDKLAARRRIGDVAAFVAYLASPACDFSGEAFSVGFGRFARVFVGEALGWVAPDPDTVTAEDVAAHLDEIRDRDGYFVPQHIYDEVSAIAARLGIA